MRPATAHARAEKIFLALEKLALSADSDLANASDDAARSEIKQEIGMYLSLMTPLAIVLDLHLPTDCRGPESPNDTYTFLQELLDE